ncbi:MAG TPA: hypothetical protein VME70_06725 [Mycobacteriales bacterium]|nr:hypothetical protein [Mycobacteriales bacterium]
MRPSDMTRGAVGLLAALALACAGCAATSSAPAPLPPGHSASPIAQQRSATAGANKAATRKEAARLLALAPVPPGSAAAPGRHAALSGPAMGTPATSSLIDLHRFWQVSSPIGTVLAYVKAHAPAELQQSGTSSGSDHGVLTSEGIAWGEPDRPYATGLQLDIGLAPVAGGTLVRADGMGEWLDPRPIRDTARGARLRVTVAGGCPTSDRGVVGVRNPGRRLDEALLPPGIPTSALICAYGGLNPPHVLSLRAHVLLGERAAARLARQALRLSLTHTDGGVESCPLDDGSFDVVAFHYASGADVDLGDHVTGCAFVANGFIEAGSPLDLDHWVKRAPL